MEYQILNSKGEQVRLNAKEERVARALEYQTQKCLTL
ncbi:hypothetical protein AAIR98_000050 [Elusimicrobium simillimum]